jgi:hypothetical protein
MFAQQQAMAQLLELLQYTKEALLQAVQDRVTTQVGPWIQSMSAPGRRRPAFS